MEEQKRQLSFRFQLIADGSRAKMVSFQQLALFYEFFSLILERPYLWLQLGCDPYESIWNRLLPQHFCGIIYESNPEIGPPPDSSSSSSLVGACLSSDSISLSTAELCQSIRSFGHHLWHFDRPEYHDTTGSSAFPSLLHRRPWFAVLKYRKWEE